MRRMTEPEAIEMLDALFGIEPEMYSSAVIEAVVGDKEAADARAEIDAHIATLEGDVNPHSILTVADVVEGSDMPCCVVTVMIGGEE